MQRNNTRSPYPKLGHRRKDTSQWEAVQSKLVPDPQRRVNPRENTELDLPRDFFDRLTSQTGQDSVDAKSVFQLLPDVELTEQILVGSILSPKDMSSVDLGFSVNNTFSSELARALLTVVEDHFKNDYKIDDQLDTMLEEILFTKGAYPLMVLPENNLDRLINNHQSKVSTEHFQDALKRTQDNLPMGFLGHPRQSSISMETFRGERDNRHAEKIKDASTEVELPGIEVTDNFNLLKQPHYQRCYRQRRIGELLGRNQVSMESATKGLSDEKIEQLYQRSANPTPEPAQMITPQSYMTRGSVGHPLVLKLPIESVVPVHVPGQPDNHIGYFLVLDENSRPVVKEEKRDYYGEIQQSFNKGRSEDTSSLVNQTKQALNGVMGGSSGGNDQNNLEAIHEAYGRILETDLQNRLRNGIYDEEYEVAFTQDIYRLMLWRSLHSKSTRLLYVPRELMTYMAFNYNEMGIGENLLNQSKILSSMRSVLLFADTMSGVRNAVGRKKATIRLDPDDPDPSKTISDIQETVLQTGQRGFPIGSPDPSLTLDYLNRAGFDFSVETENESYPATNVDYDDYTSDQQGGNSDLQDRLRRMQISGWGVNPELVDPESSPDFATSVVNNNLIMTRRVLRYQNRFTSYLTEHVRCYTRHSSILRGKLAEIIEENKKSLTKEQKGESYDVVIDNFIDAIETFLPSPDNTKLDQQSEALDHYVNILDRALEAYVTEDLFPADLLNKEPDAVSQTMAAIRSYYIRRWLENNNVMPELDELTTEIDNKTFSLLDIQLNQFETLGKAINQYINAMHDQNRSWAQQDEARNKRIEAVEGGGDENSDPGGWGDGEVEETPSDGDEEETEEDEPFDEDNDEGGDEENEEGTTEEDDNTEGDEEEPS